MSATKAIFTERLWKIDELIENHKDKVEGLSIHSNLPKRRKSAVFSQHRQHSVPTLVNNLCALVKAASQHDTKPDFFTACIIDPTLLVGRKIRYIWSTDNGDEAFMGEILGVKTTHGTSEFEILYDEHEERIFMEFDEVLTDLKCGDLQIM